MSNQDNSGSWDFLDKTARRNQRAENKKNRKRPKPQEIMDSIYNEDTDNDWDTDKEKFKKPY